MGPECGPTEAKATARVSAPLCRGNPCPGDVQEVASNGKMPFQRMISKITELPAPSHAWGMPSAQQDTGMLFSIPKQHLLLPNHPWPRPPCRGIPCSSGREPEPRPSLRRSHDGHIRELKITRLSCNRLALAPAAPAARGLGVRSHPPPAAHRHGEKGAGMEPVGAAKLGAGSRQDPPPM